MAAVVCAGGRDRALDVTALIFLGVANSSPAVLNFTRSRNSDRLVMGRGFDRITVLDAVFTAAFARL